MVEPLWKSLLLLVDKSHCFRKYLNHQYLVDYYDIKYLCTNFQVYSIIIFVAHTACMLQISCFWMNTHKDGVYLLVSHKFITKDRKCSELAQRAKAREQRQQYGNKRNWLSKKEIIFTVLCQYKNHERRNLARA